LQGTFSTGETTRKKNQGQLSVLLHLINTNLSDSRTALANVLLVLELWAGSVPCSVCGSAHDAYSLCRSSDLNGTAIGLFRIGYQKYCGFSTLELRRAFKPFQLPIEAEKKVAAILFPSLSLFSSS